MIDREFDVRAYEEGYRAGKHDAQVEIDRLRSALRAIIDFTGAHGGPFAEARAALEGK
jgi:hypothetical protein